MKFLLPVLLLASVMLHAQDPTPRRERTITLESSVPGMVVRQGIVLGSTPLRLLVVEGDTLEIWSPDPFSPGARMTRLVAPFLSSADGVVRWSGVRSFRLLSVPSGAAVWRGEVLLGRTPCTVEDSDPPRPLRVEKLGYRSLTFDPPGENEETKTLVLEPVDGMVSEPEVLAHDDGFRLPSLDIVLPSVVGLAAGVSAVIWKQEADREYTRYRETGDGSALDRTRRNDLMSGLSLVVMQAATGWLVWRLFHGK